MIRKPRVCKKCGCTRWIVSAHVVQDWEVDFYGNFQKEINSCTEVTHQPNEDDVWCCAKCGEEYTSYGEVSYKNALDIAHAIYERYQLHWMLNQGVGIPALFREIQDVYDEYEPENTSLDLRAEFENAGFGGSLWVCFDEFLGAEFRDAEFIHEICKDNEQWEMYTRALVAIITRENDGKPMTTKHKAEITVPAETAKRIEVALTWTEEDDYDNRLDEDKTISLTAVFDDGYAVDVKCCGCQYEENAPCNAAWTEAVLFDPNGCEVACSEPDDEFFTIWTLECDGEAYEVDVKVEEVRK